MICDCAIDYVETRIREFETKRKALNRRVEELRDRQKMFAQDLDWLMSLDEGDRERVFKDFTIAARDVWDELMTVMTPLDEGAYDRCMSVIFGSPDWDVIAEEFTRSCPIFILKKTEGQLGRATKEALSVTNQLNGMYEHAMRALDSLETSTTSPKF
jgi:hypothetical protein